MGIAPMMDDAQGPPGAGRAVLPAKAIRLIEANRGEPCCDSRLLAILNLVQDAAGYLSPEHLDAVSARTGLPLARLTALTAFYHYFRLAPRGRHLISLCLGAACHLKGANQICQRFMDDLGLPLGGTTADGAFTLEASRCLGTCDLAPVVMIDGTRHGAVTVEETPGLLDLHRHQAVRAPARARRPRAARGAARLG